MLSGHEGMSPKSPLPSSSWSVSYASLLEACLALGLTPAFSRLVHQALLSLLIQGPTGGSNSFSQVLSGGLPLALW